MIKRIKKNIIIETRIQLTREDIIKKFKFPEDAQISVRAPSGGDCSGEELLIGDSIQFIDVYFDEARSK